MVLAKPVLDRMGRVLLKDGEELTQPILDRLEAWGVTTVWVETPEEKEVSQASDPLSESQILAVLETRLERQFDRHANDPRMKMIKESAKKALLKRQSK